MGFTWYIVYSPFNVYYAYIPFNVYYVYSPFNVYYVYSPFNVYYVYSPFNVYYVYSPFNVYYVYSPFNVYYVYSPFNVYFSIYIYILGLSNVFGSDERSETLVNKQNKPLQTAFQNKVNFEAFSKIKLRRIFLRRIFKPIKTNE